MDTQGRPATPPGQHGHVCLADGTPTGWHNWEHPARPSQGCHEKDGTFAKGGVWHYIPAIYFLCPQHDGLPFHERS